MPETRVIECREMDRRVSVALQRCAACRTTTHKLRTKLGGVKDWLEGTHNVSGPATNLAQAGDACVPPCSINHDCKHDDCTGNHAGVQIHWARLYVR